MATSKRKPTAARALTTTAQTALDRKRSRAAKKGAITRAKNRALASKNQLRLHHKIIAGGAIAAVIVLVFLGIRGQLQSYAASTATGTFTGIAGKCLDNQHSIAANHNHIQLYRCNGTNAQRWTVTSAGSIVSGNGDGAYCLDIPSASKAEYTYLQLYRCNGTNAQKFTVSGNRIISTLTGFCVTAKYGNTANSTRIWMKTCHGTAAQKWVYGGVTSPVPPPTSGSGGSSGSSGGTSGSGGSTGSGSGNPTPTPPPSTSGKLIFDEEFNGAANAAPDPSKWELMGGTNPSRWGEECFVNDRTHIKLDGQGHLVETATYNPSGVPCKNGSGPYESGGMDTGSATGGLFSYKYGTAEARIQVPCQSGTGIWSGWWADGPNWPKGGEIDFLEIMKVGQQGYTGVQTLHGPTSSGGSWQTPYSTTASTRWCEAYHTYGAIWSPKQIQFTIDGKVTHSFSSTSIPAGAIWPFDSAAERLLIDLQVGGWGGTPNPATFPQSMYVDYVRVYQ